MVEISVDQMLKFMPCLYLVGIRRGPNHDRFATALIENKRNFWDKEHPYSVFGLWPWNRSRRKHQKWIVMNVKRATLSLLYALLLLRHWHQYNILSVLALPSRKCHTHFMFIFVNIYIRTCVGKTFDIWCVHGMKTCLAQCKCHRTFYYIHENNK